MTVGERILLACCRRPESPEYAGGTTLTNLDNALSFLEQTVPGFGSLIEGKSVLDFGCGHGYQSLALARCGLPYVVGLDLPRPALMEQWRKFGREFKLPNVVFTTEIPDGRLFDLVISCGSFEHFGDPEAILRMLCAYTKPGGRVIITFAQPWLSPYGSHMDGFTRLPWVNVLFPERTVMRVRARFRNDGAARYADVEGGLNRMTVRRFEKLIRQSGMTVECLNLFPIKGLPVVAKIPVLREFLVGAVSCILARPEDAALAAAEAAQPALSASRE